MLLSLACSVFLHVTLLQYDFFHMSVGEPGQLKYVPMTDLPDSSSDSDNEFTKLKGNLVSI